MLPVRAVAAAHVRGHRRRLPRPRRAKIVVHTRRRALPAAAAGPAPAPAPAPAMQQQLLQPFDVLLDKSLEADKNLAPAARLESLKDKRMMAIQFFEQKIRDVEFEMGVPPAHAAGAEYVVSSNVCLAELGHALSKGSPSSAKKALGRGLTKMSLRALPRDSNRRAPHRLPRSF